MDEYVPEEYNGNDDYEGEEYTEEEHFDEGDYAGEEYIESVPANEGYALVTIIDTIQLTEAIHNNLNIQTNIKHIHF